jgi:hypothetical protein
VVQTNLGDGINYVLKTEGSQPEDCSWKKSRNLNWEEGKRMRNCNGTLGDLEVQEHVLENRDFQLGHCLHRQILKYFVHHYRSSFSDFGVRIRSLIMLVERPPPKPWNKPLKLPGLRHRKHFHDMAIKSKSGGLSPRLTTEHQLHPERIYAISPPHGNIMHSSIQTLNLSYNPHHW